MLKLVAQMLSTAPKHAPLPWPVPHSPLSSTQPVSYIQQRPHCVPLEPSRSQFSSSPQNPARSTHFHVHQDKTPHRQLKPADAGRRFGQAFSDPPPIPAKMAPHTPSPHTLSPGARCFQII